MHVTHIYSSTSPNETLCGEPIVPRPEGRSTAQCSKCYIISVSGKDPDGEQH